MVKNVISDVETVWMKSYAITKMGRVFPGALQDGREKCVIKVSF